MPRLGLFRLVSLSSDGWLFLQIDILDSDMAGL